MRRRKFIGIAGGATVWPLVAYPQPSVPVAFGGNSVRAYLQGNCTFLVSWFVGVPRCYTEAAALQILGADRGEIHVTDFGGLTDLLRPS